MKKLMTVALLLLFTVSLVAGCAKQPAADTQPATEEQTAPQNAQVANPWSSWDSIAEAEAATGFSFGLPETIAEVYTADTIRTMNGQLFEVVYLNGEDEVCVRKQKGEGQDISGDYTEYQSSQEKEHNGVTVVTHYNSDNAAVKQLISSQGYSWSLVAPNGYAEAAEEAFLNAILP